MGNKPSNKKKYVIEEKVNLELNFSEISELVVNTHEIKNSFLTGKHGANHTLKPANIVLSKIAEFKSKNGDFGYVDFKDSFITESVFENSSFDYGAIINSQFENVSFINCTFKNVSITEVEFDNVQFLNCNLSHMVIESCNFNSCTFRNNITSNKLFELCGFFDTRFVSTEIQIQTLLSNFGLNKHCFEDLKIRNQSTKFDFEYLSSSQIKSTKTITILEAFKLEYFYSPESLQSGSDLFEKTFEIDSWINTARIPKTFTNLLSLYQEFLLYHYELEKLNILPLIKLHSLTDQLINKSFLNSTIVKDVYGVHLTLAKIVEVYLHALSFEVSRAQNPLVLIVNGPLDKEYYKNNLPLIFNREGIEITKIVKHNSPNELFFSWESIQNILPIIAIIMASKLKFEIESFNKDMSVKSSSIPLSVSERTSKKPFELSLGFDSDSKLLYGLKLKSILPGDMLMELGIHISLKKVDSVRKTILKIFSSDE